MKNSTRALWLLIGMSVLASCASAPPPAATTPASDPDVYEGAGRGESLGPAMSAAKIDAIRKATEDILGPATAANQEETLEEVLYSTRNPNAYLYPETMETLRKENVGTIDDMEMVYEIRIRVNKEAIEQTLRAHGIGGETAGAQEQAEAAAQTAVGEVMDEKEPAPDFTSTQDDWGEVSEDDRRFIRRYVDTMTYMVYFEETATDEFLMDSAVAQANSYLASNGMLAIDADQIEQIKEDQKLIYEEEAGQEVSIIQWVAQKLNADVYIKLDVTAEGTSRSGNHYGNATVTLSMYETSTGQVLGSVNRASQRTLSKTSETDAVLNAVLSTVYQAMPYAIDQSKTQMAQNLKRGIRYEVVIQETPDPRVMSTFRRRLRDRVRDLITVSQTAQQTTYEVFFLGRIDGLEDLIYDVSEVVPGLEGMYQVITRGKSITFNSGM
jgi:hypothetical protein